MNENIPAISVPPPSRFLAFFDECGDHSLDKIDRDFPLFVLALVLVERSVYQNQILPEFNNFKLRYFNHEGINLHSRDKREDNMLEQVFSRMMTQGTANVSAEQFQQLDCPLSFQSKKNNILGVQLADLCAHPCARHILNPAKPNRAFEIARKRLYQRDGVSGWKVVP